MYILWLVWLGVVHKQHLIKGGGVRGKKCHSLFSKKKNKGEGDHKIRKIGRRFWMAPYVNFKT